MKKQLLIFLTFISISITVNAQYTTENCIVKLQGANDGGLSIKNDTLNIYFKPTAYFWYINVKNNLSSDISINWDKSSFIINKRSSKIIFDNTLKIDQSASIPNEEIPGGSFIDRNIFPADYLDPLTPTISRRFVKQRFEETGQADVITIILAMDTNNSTIKKRYDFYVIPKLKK